MASLPLTIFADSLRAVETTTEGNVASRDELETEEQILLAREAGEIVELVSERTRNTKVYIMPDGSYTTAMYDEPVHYLGQDGYYKEIDNTLRYVKATSAADRYDSYQAQNGIGVSFAARAGYAGQVTLTSGARSVSFAMINETLTRPLASIAGELMQTGAYVEPNKKELSSMAKMQRQASGMMYRNVADGVNLAYYLRGETLYEHIIVTKPGTGKNEYIFSLSVTGMTATLTDEGEIHLTDNTTNEVVFVIPRSYMEDAAGAYSEAVSYSLEVAGDGVYRLTITADEGWMSAEEREYPVIIDPPITTLSSVNVTDTYVYSGDLSSHSMSQELYISSNRYTLLRFNILPILPDGAQMTEALLRMTYRGTSADTDPYYVGVSPLTESWSGDINYTTFTQLELYENKGELLDYYPFSSYHREDAYFNITSIVQEWYVDDDENYGLLLHGITESAQNDYGVFYASESVDRNTLYRSPVLQVSFVLERGYDSDYPLLSHDLGDAGTGYVNLYNRELTIVTPLTESAEEIFSYVPYLTHSSLRKNELNQVIEGLCTPYGWRIDYMQSVKQIDLGTRQGYSYIDGDGTEHIYLSTNEERIETTEVNGQTITVIYSIYQEQNNSACEIYKVKSGTAPFPYQLLSSESNIIYCFDAEGVLSRIVSASHPDVYISFTHVSQTIDFIDYKNTYIRLHTETDTVTDLFTVFYSSNDMISRIKNMQTGEQVDFEVSNNLYRRLLGYQCIANGETIKFSYDNFGRVKKVRDVKACTYTEYTYDDDAMSVRVGATTGPNTDDDAICYYEADEVTYRYYPAMTAVHYKDRVYETRYIFDKHGRVTTSYMVNTTDGTVYGTNGYSYEEETGDLTHALSQGISYTDTALNLLPQGSFDGDVSAWTTSSGAFRTIDSMFAQSGSGVMCLTYQADGGNQVAHQTVFLSAGTYTFSGYVRCQPETQNTGYYVALELHGDTLYKSVSFWNGEGGTKDGYVFVHMTFTLDADDYVTVLLEIFSMDFTCPVTAWVDSLSLVRGDVPSLGSLINAGDMEQSGFWTFSDIDDITYGEDETAGSEWFHGGTAIKIEGEPGVPYTASQRVLDVTPEFMFDKPAQYYVLSAWAKANSGSPYTFSFSGRTDMSRTFGVRVTIYYVAQGPTTYEDFTDTLYFPFNASCTEWQNLTVGFRTQAGMEPYRMTVELCYENNINTAYFDNVTLRLDDGYITDYTYDGRELSTITTDGKTTTISREANADGTTTTTYDGTQIDISVTEDDESKQTNSASVSAGDKDLDTTYTYTAWGQVAGTEIKGTDENGGTYIISTGMTYSTDAKKLGSVLTSTDAAGYVTKYYYDQTTGRPVAVISPDGNGICYEYNEVGQLIAVKQAEATTDGYQVTTGGTSVSYTYNEKGQITAIQTSTMRYLFYFDTYGYVTQISSQLSDSTTETLIATYDYDERGKLLSMIYGGTAYSVVYTYDELERISLVEYKNGETVVDSLSYGYDYAGNLVSLTDGDTEYIYTYDLKGNLTRSAVYEVTGTNRSLVYLVEMRYDEKDRVTDTILSKDGETAFAVYHTTYNEETGEITEWKVNDTFTLTQETDMLDRLSQKTISTYYGGDLDLPYDALVTEYSYRDLSSGQTHTTDMRVTRIQHNLAGVDFLRHTYLYDRNGRITVYSTHDQDFSIHHTFSYAYDDLGQLQREFLWDYTTNTCTYWYEYTYDAAGNRLTKSSYTSSSYNQRGTLLSSETYTYVGDRMTSVQTGGVTRYTVTYDAQGNPISYLPPQGQNAHTLAYTMQGRLASMTYGETGVLYEYNTDNIRIGKTDRESGAYVTYIVDGSRIMREEHYSAQDTLLYTLDFLYESDGSLLGFTYQGPSELSSTTTFTCLYLKNLQGDIVGLYNQTDTILVRYMYDAWGNIIDTICADGGVLTSVCQLLAEVNPFRYRGYYYDTETGFYYLNSRYYDPATGRFLTKDAYVSTGQGLFGANMYQYCENDPVDRVDPSGKLFVGLALLVGIVAASCFLLTGCAEVSQSPRSDLANAPNLDVTSAPANAYNCYGNGIGKEIRTNPTGYQTGESTRTTFERVVKDLGQENVRELSSINDPIADNEFKVAMKCGALDYHFIRFNGDQWYNKSGTLPGVYISQSDVEAEVWYPMYMVNGKLVKDTRYPYSYETIYFAVKVGWDRL